MAGRGTHVEVRDFAVGSPGEVGVGHHLLGARRWVAFDIRQAWLVIQYPYQTTHTQAPNLSVIQHMHMSNHLNAHSLLVTTARHGRPEAEGPH